jgi:hypothetical protein
MAEIHGFVWSAVGVFIAVVSLFLGFLRPVEYNAFFKLMLFVGIGMLVYGLIKMKIKQKTPQQIIEERRQHMLQKGQREVEIDIDNYRKNPQLRQQVLQQGAHSGATAHHGTPGTHTQHPTQHHTTPQRTHHPAHAQQQTHQTQAARFCHQCGTPLLKHHKFCPICGARV